MAKHWVYDPHSGGVDIPDRVREKIQQRILTYAEEHYADKYTRIEVRFKGKFCYIDAYTEPQLSPGWPPADFPSCARNSSNGYAIPRHICAAYATSATRIVGRLHSTLTATSDMNLPSSPMEPLRAPQKRRLRPQPMCI